MLCYDMLCYVSQFIVLPLSCDMDHYMLSCLLMNMSLVYVFINSCALQTHFNGKHL